MAMPKPDPAHLRGLVDMGSNGIRFSISDLHPATARIVPTLFQSRTGISLYDAQYPPGSNTRHPIPSAVTSSVIAALVQFKSTCQDFSVPETNITVLATEATRTAPNSAEFRAAIKTATGWDVTLLPKEEEGRVGALGVASSLGEVRGLIMDLGGGSTQLTWLMSHGDDGLRMPDGGAVSLPFGAAALTRRLKEAEKAGGGAREAFAREIQGAIGDAYASLNVPRELQGREGVPLYLSGGGFRGWGFVLMDQHKVKPYPIPIINGFSAGRREFMDVGAVTMAVAGDDTDGEAGEVFRISERRASQVPAVAFLVTALSAALPQISCVRFCQGGVREGFLFSSLPAEVRAESPLVVATRPYAGDSGAIAKVLASAVPAPLQGQYDIFAPINGHMLAALASTMNTHSTYARDIRPSSALRFTTTGPLAAVHGLSHTERAILSLLLCERWGGEKGLPPTDLDFYRRMAALLDPWTLWAVRYLGRVAGVVGTIYPASTAKGGERVRIESKWTEKKKGDLLLHLAFSFKGDDTADPLARTWEAVGSEINQVGKMGKKKHWSGGKDGAGCKIDCTVGLL